MVADFSGYATKANLRCSDGRTIMPDAFKHMDGQRVPLVWQHGHNEPANVLGHAFLESRDGDVYCHAHFNSTPAAQNAKELVKHGDINALSIYANRLVEKSKNVMHGIIREVSLVLTGANPGALIDNVNIAHGDGEYETLDDEAVIYTGLTLTHSDEGDDMADEDDRTVADVYETFNPEQKEAVHFLLGEALAGAGVSHADEVADAGDDMADDAGADEGSDKTVKDVFDSFTKEQKDVVYFMIGQALEDAKASTPTAQHSDFHQEGSTMTHNVFEKDSKLAHQDQGPVLSHADAESIFDSAKRLGSMKEAAEEYVLKHGIDDIGVLFPDAKSISSTPEFEKRRTEWVAEVMTATRHTPFSRIKSLTANLTLDEARAKGYVKGNLKKEEFFKVSKRVTTPQTIYKKQKLDRDDVLDITDFDVVAWLKGEMRLMLEEELARAILVGDGRSVGDDDKISEEHIRPIANDSDLYVTYLYVNLNGADFSAEEIIDSVTMQRRHYRGSGNPTFYTSETVLARMLLIKDSLGRRIYPTVNDLAAALRVTKIVAVEIMDEPSVDVVGIIVNLSDYTVGADKGGDVSLFDDFDIDYNQYKYLIETRVSGALVRPKAALVLKAVANSAILVTPEAPEWDDATKSIMVPEVTGIVYKNKMSNQTISSTTGLTLQDGDEVTVIAIPASANYYLASSTEDEWLFTFDDGLLGGPF